MTVQRSRYMIDKVGLDFPERRECKRGPGMLSACLICGDDGRMAKAVLLNISTMGAQVQFDKSSGDGENVDLSSGLRLMIAPFINYPVEVIWQNESVIGLCFLADPREIASALEKFLPKSVRFEDVEMDDA